MHMGAQRTVDAAVRRIRAELKGRGPALPLGATPEEILEIVMAAQVDTRDPAVGVALERARLEMEDLKRRQAWSASTIAVGLSECIAAQVRVEELREDGAVVLACADGRLLGAYDLDRLGDVLHELDTPHDLDAVAEQFELAGVVAGARRSVTVPPADRHGTHLVVRDGQTIGKVYGDPEYEFCDPPVWIVELADGRRERVQLTRHQMRRHVTQLAAGDG
jgi:hypothetical protein